MPDEASAKSGYCHVAARDDEVRFERTGSGPALLLAGRVFRLFPDPVVEPLVNLLAEDFTVYEYQRVHRHLAGNAAPFVVQREIEDLGRLLEIAGGSAYLAGIAAGAAIGLEAVTRGLEIEKMALYEPPFVVVDKSDSGASDPGEVDFFFSEKLDMPSEIRATLSAVPPWPVLEDIAKMVIFDVTVMEGALSGLPVPVGRWKAIRAPTLVIDGSGSPEYRRRTAVSLAEVFPGARSRTVKSEGLDISPIPLAEAIREFFLEDTSRRSD